MKVRMAVTMIVVVALTMIGALAAPKAASQPTPTPAAAGSGGGWIHHRVSSATMKIIKAGAHARNSTNSKYLDHRQAKKAFGGMEIIYRRRFEAGWRKGGGHLTHISARESRAMSKIVRSLRPRSVRNGQAIAVPMSPNCRGTTKTVNGHAQGNAVFFKSIMHQWFNSCDTNKIRYGYETCAAGYGLGMVLVGGTPWMKVLMAIGVFICTVNTGEVIAAQNNSSLNAVIIDTTFKNNPAPVAPEVWAEVRPQ